MNKILTYIIIFLIVLLSAVSDGMYDEGLKAKSKIIENVSWFFWFLLVVQNSLLLGRWWRNALLIAGIIACVRFSFFDLTYNLTRPELLWDYYGTTAGYWSSFRSYTGFHYWWLSFIIFILSLSLANHLEEKK